MIAKTSASKEKWNFRYKARKVYIHFKFEYDEGRRGSGWDIFKKGDLDAMIKDFGREEVLRLYEMITKDDRQILN